MTTTEEDIDDFEFDDEFAEDWDNNDLGEGSFSENEEPQVNELAGASTVENNGLKPKSNGKIYTASILFALLASAGGYYGYTHFLSTPSPIPVIQISSQDSETANTIITTNVAEALPQEEKTNVNIIVEQHDIVEENEAPLVLESQDDVLTPLPKAIDRLDITLADLSDENTSITETSTENLNNFDNDKFIDDIEQSIFDEKEMLAKTESSPIDEEPVSNADNPDIFEHIEEIESSNSEENSVSTPVNVIVPDNVQPIDDATFEGSKTSEPKNNKISADNTLETPKNKIEKTVTVVEKATAQPIFEENKVRQEKPKADPKPVQRVKINWKIKAIQPGKAVIRDQASGMVKSVEIGEYLYETGTISKITKRNGKWVIMGKKGTITQ